MEDFATFANSRGTGKKSAERICKNKPSQDAQGHLYWPRIYLMEDNGETKAVSAICENGVELSDHAKAVSTISDIDIELSDFNSDKNLTTAADPFPQDSHLGF
jgi:hypothetical protein